jgi:hypothetical protein
LLPLKVKHFMPCIVCVWQARCERNNQFDECVQDIGFIQLISDPCAYIWRESEDFQIITVWIDNLLLFANTNKGMRIMKAQIEERWQVTDLNKPSKIIDIEIMCEKNYISISQNWYIEFILNKERMIYANPIATPLDTHIPIELNLDQ